MRLFPRTVVIVPLALAAALLVFGAGPNPHTDVALAAETSTPCERSARHAHRACMLDAEAEFWRAVSRCDHIPDSEARRVCRTVAREAYEESVAECEEVRTGRVALCSQLPMAHHPEIDPDGFVAEVTNELFPLIPGTVWIYREVTEEGVFDTEIEVLTGKRRFSGIHCTPVVSTVTNDGEPVEQTIEWFAQDIEGNVWLFGEFSREYLNAQIIEIETWTTGREGAKPGIIMPANPAVGDFFRQGLAIDVSEDTATIVGSGETLQVPAGEFRDVWISIDESPLEPDDIEEKYYAPGVGMVLELDLVTGDRMELVEVRLPE